MSPLQDGLLFPSKKGKSAQKEPKARAAVVSSEAVLPNGHPNHAPSGLPSSSEPTVHREVADPDRS